MTAPEGGEGATAVAIKRSVTVWTTAALIGAVATWLWAPVSASPPPSMTLVVLLTLGSVATGMVFVRAPLRDVSESMDLGEVGLVPAMVLLPPPLLLLVGAIATIAAEAVITRGRLQRIVFNVAWRLVGLELGVVVYLWLAGRGFDGSPRTILAAAAASLVLVLVNVIAFSRIVALSGQRPWRTVLATDGVSGSVLMLATAALGILTAVLIALAPAALPLLLVLLLPHLSRVRDRGADNVRLAVERTRFERAVEATSDGVALLDSAGRVEVWNPQLETFTGVGARGATGRPFSALACGELVAVTVGGGGRMTIGRREYDVRVAPVHITAYQSGGTVISVRDVTREAELARIREDLVARVSHELRTPLVSVLGFLETLESRWGRLGEQQRVEFVAAAWRGAKRLDRLVEKLTVFSRDGAGGSPGAVETTDVPAVARRVLAEFGLTVRPGGVPSVAAAVASDDLHTILTNLVENAIVYGRQPIEVEVSVHAETVAVAVTDHGPGLPEEFLPSLYEPFTQVSNGTRRTAKGLGVGLAATRRLVEDAGGRISYEHVTGEDGARFRVTLPRAARDPLDEVDRLTLIEDSLA